jgi:hypothetical protein
VPVTVEMSHVVWHMPQVGVPRRSLVVDGGVEAERITHQGNALTFCVLRAA